MASEIILSCERLVKIFGSGHTEVRAVDDVSLTIGRGELVLVMGPSGSGKTTLLSMLGGLLRPSSGKVCLDGLEITALDESRMPGVRARSIGFVFQSFNLLDALTVEENILFPARLVPGSTAGARKRAYELGTRLGLEERWSSKPRTLSGGEKQRVAIARALINSPPLILADEPTGNLDSVSGQEVMMILHDIARDEGRSVILVSHDPRVEDIADHIFWLEDGSLRDRKGESHSWAHDPVCGMRVDEWTSEIFTTFEERRFVFCSGRCLERFNDEPERYAHKVPASPHIQDSGGRQ